MFQKSIIRQCKRPTGWLGRFVGRRMNSVHTPLRHWGLERVALDPQGRILDVGCGGGQTVRELAGRVENGKIFGIDLSSDMVHLSRKVNRRLIDAGKVDIKQAGVSSLPFDDDVFDLVTAFETWYFWPQPEQDLREIRRVLKPGGTILVANDAYHHEDFEERNQKWLRWADIRLDTPEEYRLFLEKAGFTGVHIELWEEENRIAATAQAT